MEGKEHRRRATRATPSVGVFFRRDPFWVSALWNGLDACSQSAAVTVWVRRLFTPPVTCQDGKRRDTSLTDVKCTSH